MAKRESVFMLVAAMAAGLVGGAVSSRLFAPGSVTSQAVPDHVKVRRSTTLALLRSVNGW